jgi:hypothetical protein
LPRELLTKLRFTEAQLAELGWYVSGWRVSWIFSRMGWPLCHPIIVCCVTARDKIDEKNNTENIQVGGGGARR